MNFLTVLFIHVFICLFILYIFIYLFLYLQINIIDLFIHIYLYLLMCGTGLLADGSRFREHSGFFLKNTGLSSKCEMCL